MTIKPGSMGCGATFLDDLEISGSTWIMFTAGNGAATGTATEEETFKEPGTHTLCAYLQTRYDAPSASAASGPVTLNIRQAHASVGIATPPHVSAGQRFGINLPVTAELARRVYLTVKPAGGRGCEPAYSLDAPNSDDVFWDDVQGTRTIAVERTATTTSGSYLLCAYVQENSDDLEPEATASATFIVGPDPCVAAKSTLAKAQKTMRLADAAVKRFRKLVKRKPKTYRQSYKTAVRTRANARKQPGRAGRREDGLLERGLQDALGDRGG
ncbi:hypothetical protein OJ997_10355 [Solirubrobacter phytolaccae]|uniref:Uncharacterized protein n=1 Tax=Solirubrobacter phytolaccae TaxID=1404360 RepID=A0A9X3S764_9ACTN|nr:hypothetical protein [Solirubrobacter phytolaccae]MDA0180694.1 hypothetical protein [Solirubrobacter phytolaccae]